MDRVSPPQEAWAPSYYTGPVFNVRSGVTPAAAGKQDDGFVVSGFEGTFADQKLAVWFGSSAEKLTVNFTGPCGGCTSRGCGNPSPDACRVDSPDRLNGGGFSQAGAGGGFSQLFSMAEAPSGSSTGFVTVLAPAGTDNHAQKIVETATAKFAADGAISLGPLFTLSGVELIFCGTWLAAQVVALK